MLLSCTATFAQPATAPTAAGDGVARVRAVVADADSKTREKDLQAVAKAYPKDGPTLHAVGASLLLMKRADLARPPLDAAYKLAGNAPSADLLYNVGVCDLLQKANALRSIKQISDYLEAHPEAPDERLQNLLGSLMSLAARNKIQRKSPVFVAAVEVYVETDRRLEAARADGQRRWGGQWISGDDYELIELEKSRLNRRLTPAVRRLEQNRADLDEAEARLKRVQGSFLGGKKSSSYEVNDARAQVESAKDNVRETEQTIADLRKAMPRPQWATAHRAAYPAEMVASTGAPAADPFADAANAEEVPTLTFVPPAPVAPAADDASEPQPEPEAVERPVAPKPARASRKPAADEERVKPDATSIFDF